MQWMWYLLMLVVQVTGLFLNILGLPGLWIMVAALVGFAWVTQFDRYVGWHGIISVLVLAVIAEILEFFAGSAGAKKAGASRRAMVGAIVGGLIGGFLFTIPLPIIGTIFGVCIGCFIGAALVEMGVVGSPDHAFRVGWGAAKGRFWGIMLKLAVGIVMFIVSAVVAFPV
jgi:uncharacterized protein YqgC (DUF456 family)